MDSNPPLPPPITRKNQKQAPLSFSQESLWFLQQLDPENHAYNLNNIYQFTGGIDHACMERAVNEMIRRHEPLRTVYQLRDGRPIQVIQPFMPFPLPYRDFSNLVEDDWEPAMRRFVAEQGNPPYDLQHGPLVRFTILHFASEKEYLIFSTHHIISDAWSRQVFRSELLHFYNAFRSGSEPRLTDLPLQYADYAVWQRDWLSGSVLAAYLDHWKNVLSDGLPVLEVPHDHPRPSFQASRAKRYYFRIQPSISARVKEFCQAQHLTPFRVYLAAYAIMLMRYTGQEDLVIGCPFANRPLPELDGVIGDFVNTLPVRLDLAGDPRVGALLRQVQSVMTDAFTWQAVPFESLVSELSPERDLSRTSIFQVLINMRNVPKRMEGSAGLNVEDISGEDIHSPFDLSLEFDYEGSTVVPSLQYNGDLFDEKTIVHMAAHFQNLLGELVQNSERHISDLEMLTPSERNRILNEWNDTTDDFPQVCINDLISMRVEEAPDALAVLCNGSSLSYRSLEGKANQLAHYLRNKGVAAESRVGIFLPRSEKSIIALLAVFKAGGAYVPLDLAYPPERLNFIVQDSDPAVIITLSSLESQLPAQYQRILLDSDEGVIDACDHTCPAAVTNNESLLYLIYTSGTTGRPKGAMNIHKGLVNYLSFMKKHLKINSSDRAIQLTSLSFDVSFMEIFGTLSCGGLVILMDDNQMRDPDYIVKSIIDQRATYLSCVPTMLRALGESALASGRKQDSLRLIVPAGEALREADVLLARQAFGNSAVLVNQYGPTECSIIHTSYEVPPELPSDLQIVPIGKPICNARAYVLDKYYHPVPVGTTGELFIGGVGVGRGYWNRPDLTADKFLPDPFLAAGQMYRTGDNVRQLPDGTICFIGRSDHQVKLRGYRVELGEIEAIINEFTGIKDAVVILITQDCSEALAAYVTLTEGKQGFSMEGLHQHLKDRLPFYMLPSSITILKEMPVTPSGKVDRLALPHPEKRNAQSNFLAPRNDVEKRLVAIWKEILGVEKIGIRDNFFELGGHSLLAVRLFSRITDEFGRSLPLFLLFKDGTVEALAVALNQEEHAAQHEVCIPIQKEGSRSPLFCVSPTVIDVVTYHALSRALGSDQPFFALYAPRWQEGSDPIPPDPVDSFLAAVRQHQPSGPYILAGYSRGGQQAVRLAHRLVDLGERVELVILLDTFAPDFPKFYPWVTPGILNGLRVLRRIQSYFWKFWILDRQGKRDLILSEERPFTIHFGEWIKNRSRELKRKNRSHRTVTPSPDDMTRYRDYSGTVILLRARQGLLGAHDDPTLGWSTWLQRPVEVQQVPGDHESILFGPRIHRVAAIINGYLKRTSR